MYLERGGEWVCVFWEGVGGGWWGTNEQFSHSLLPYWDTV